MEALTHIDVEDFVAVAGDFLDADLVNHSVHLTTVDSARRDIRPLAALISLHDNGSLLGAVIRMQDRPVHVAAMPPVAARVVTDTLRGQEIDAVTGPVDHVEAFRTLWRDGGRETYRLRLYPPADVTFPGGPPRERRGRRSDQRVVAALRLRRCGHRGRLQVGARCGRRPRRAHGGRGEPHRELGLPGDRLSRRLGLVGVPLVEQGRLDGPVADVRGEHQ